MTTSSSSSSYCTDSLGLSYDCDFPLPRSAFNESGPLCGGLAEYLYDPANCDAGYWCGCASTDPALCFPTNDTAVSRWGGRFTTIDKTTNETVVLVGSFDGVSNKCPSHYYCPGKTVVGRCPDLCEPGMICPDPGELLPCPEGFYCPVASIEPVECSGLEACTEEGQRRFFMARAAGVLLILLIASIGYLYVGSYMLKKQAKKRKDAMMALKEEILQESKHSNANKKGANVHASSILTGDAQEEVDADASESPEAFGTSPLRNLPGAKEVNTDDEEEELMIHAVRKMEDDVVDKEDIDYESPIIDDTSPVVAMPPPGAQARRRRRSTLTAPQFTIDIEFERLSLTIPNVGTIMRGVSGKLHHGQLTAVMGPSGAGKTTFLTIMAGKIDRTGGTLRVNGQEKELTSFREDIGFVPQEDVMLRELSVEEIITHSALMRLPNDWSHEKKLARVDEVIESLDIDHIRDSVVGDEKRRGISGGQRKRVNIAMEMVVKPSLLCLDEPTSGLDSTTSFTVINSLKEMASAGANVITVLHQPKYEVFELFDNVLLLGQGGMTVYYGPTVDMPDYFAKRGFPCPQRANPADFYMDVLSGIIPHATDTNFDKEDLFEAWMCAPENPDAVSVEEAAEQMKQIRDQVTKSSAATKKKVGICSGVTGHVQALVEHLARDFQHREKTRETPGYVGQTWLLFKRAALQRLRSPGPTVLNIVLMAIAGAVLPALVPDDAVLYVGIPKSLEDDTFGTGREAYLRQNVSPQDFIPGTLTNIYMFLLIVSCLSVNVLGSERTVFFRDTAAGQSVVAYWFAKMSEMLIWIPLFACSFVLLGYSSDAWFLQPLVSYWLFIMFCLLGFYGMGMVASLLVGAGSAALLSLVFGIIVLIMFSGTVNAYGDESAGMQTFINFWFMFWSTQGMVVEEYDRYAYAFDIPRLNAQTPAKLSSDFGVGGQSVGAGKGFGFDLDSGFARNLGFCALTAFAWQLLVLWTLKTKDHKKHR